LLKHVVTPADLCDLNVGVSAFALRIFLELMILLEAAPRSVIARGWHKWAL
jgi:hypothetical protein